MKHTKLLLAYTAIALGIISLMPTAVGAVDLENFASISTTGTAIEFVVNLSDYDRMILAVSAPDGAVTRQEFAEGVVGSFGLFDEDGFTQPDGSYTYELRLIPNVSASVRRQMVEARASGTEDVLAGQLIAGGIIPSEAISQSGYFTIANGSFVSENVVEFQDGSTLAAPQSSDTGATGGSGGPTSSNFDQVILDDLIVDGSICVGQDCVNGESFGFDTIRLKENNLRIRAVDTSSTSSFPSRDWQLTFNDSANGGANKFSVDDIDGGRTPFTIEGNAPSHSLYVDDGGRIGVGTSTPVVEIHVKNGDTPTLRLEQDGSSGFTPQTWDVASNETNFFVRDATNGSTLPLRIRPGAPSSSIDVAADGDVGIGTSSPNATLHVRDAAASMLVESTSGDATLTVTGDTANHASMSILDTNTDTANDQLLELESAGGAPFMRFTSTFRTWDFSAGNIFSMNASGGAGNELTLDSGGNLVITGTITTALGPKPIADYVFEPDYNLMDLTELEGFVKTEKHLPGIPSADEVTAADGMIDMTSLQIKLLEKIEELTLYTLQQQNTIQQLEERLVSLETK